MMPRNKFRFLIGKIGLDGHDRGALVVAKHIQKLGHEVIYSGLFNTPKDLVRITSQEDVDVLGISVMAGSPTLLISDLLEEFKLAKEDLPNIFVGGVINEFEINELKSLGVHHIFPTGTQLSEITIWIKKLTEITYDE